MTDSTPWIRHFGDRLSDAVEDSTRLVGGHGIQLLGGAQLLGDKGALVLGGKGVALHELTRLGYPVPPGFTIITDACNAYFSAGREWPPRLWEQVEEGVARLERESGRKYGQGPDPLLLAVRGGGPQSMPGMLETILNCGREGDRWRMLREAITTVWNSWYAPRAVQYRRARGLSDSPRTAVHVQVMFAVDRAGVLFSRDPRDASSGRMLIEAVEGSGDQLVSGNTSPSAELLSQSQVDRLHTLGRELESHFNGPVDVEWGLAGDSLIVFQVRSIAPTASDTGQQQIRSAELSRLRDLTAAAPRVWARHSLSETLPTPTPMTWDIVRPFMSGAGGYGRLYRRLGFRPSPRICEHGFLDLVLGRIYADIDRLPELFCGGLPLRYDTRRLSTDPSALDRSPTQFDPRLTDYRFLPRLPRMLWVIFRVPGRMRRLAPRAGARFDADVLPPFLKYVREQQGQDLSDLPDSPLLDLLARRRARVLDQFAPEAMLPGLLGGWALDDFQRRLVRLLGEPDAQRLRGRLFMGLGEAEDDLPSALSLLTEGSLSHSDFIARFGHRGAGEMELANPRWCEDNGLLVETVSPHSPVSRSPGTRSLGATPSEGRGAEDARSAGERTAGERAAGITGAEMRASADRNLAECLVEAGASSSLADLQRRLELARRLLPYRERGKDAWMRGYQLIRDVLQELGRRWELGSDIYFLALDELPRFTAESDHLRARAAMRRDEWAVLRRVPLPDILDSRQLEQLLETPDVAPRRPALEGPPLEVPPLEGLLLKGAPLSGGKARGPARHVVELLAGRAAERDFAATGFVLVCPAVDPGLTPLLLRACALVVERGGVLSHGALVARQMGIPAVACSQAMRAIGRGATVTVDGDLGIVRVEASEL